MPKRLTRHLVWAAPPTAPPSETVSFSLTPAAQKAITPGQLDLDFFTTPREQAIYLLHIGAEVEQALMVEYLYAGYSLGGPQVVDPEHQKLVQQWRNLVLEIAREEMGHLATVENMLTLIGGPLSFEREDYPIPQDLYPFPFELERLTKKSLGKYVLAESPDEATLVKLGLQDEIEQILQFVGTGPDETKVNRVGIIYSKIQQLFTAPTVPKDPPPIPPAFIASSDIQADSIRFQVKPSEWGLGYKDILIETATDRPTAINAINAIALQGEGSTVGPLEKSHFGKFLNIYRQFPDEGDWEPSRNVARNPTTDREAPLKRRITNKQARLWAGLSNLRYRMLLMYLSHAFRVESAPTAEVRTPRGLLISWAFGEMYNIRSITEILMVLPLHDGGEVLAGPPFEMPYSLSLPAGEANRWRMHRDLLLASQRYVAELKAAKSDHLDYLNGLHSANERALNQALTLIGG